MNTSLQQIYIYRILLALKQISIMISPTLILNIIFTITKFILHHHYTTYNIAKSE